jgi:DNA repair protein SbcC/Rad50
MRLHRLALTNFRQHAATEIRFRPGLTGIIGPNGAGKSTLLEAVAWAIYGAAAARGTNETIRFARADPGSPVRVDLDFDLGGHRFRIARSLTAASVHLDDGDTPVATTVRGVTEYLERRLGMRRDEFFNTYFTGQKELQFLAQMGPAERGRFLAQVLGYERLRAAQGRARARRNELRHEIDGVRAGMSDPVALRARLDAARGRREEARVGLDIVRAALEGARAELAAQSATWAAGQASQERAAQLEHAREIAAQEYREAGRAVARIEREAAAAAEAERELDGMRQDLALLPELTRACERYSELARLDERRRVLDERVTELRAEVAALDARVRKLDQAPTYAGRFRAELAELRTELAEVESRAERERDAWQQDRQEVRTRLRTYTDRTAELQQQLDQLREAGPDGSCPTCDRPLHDHFDQVMRGLEDEWESLVQDGKWLKKRESQLERKPEALSVAEHRRDELQSLIAARTDKLARSEQAMEERAKLGAELEQRRARLVELDAELAGLPGGYDAAEHRVAEDRLAALREMERRAARLDAIASGRARLEAELDDVVTRRAQAEIRGKAVRDELEALGLDRSRLEELRASHATAKEAVRVAELRSMEARGRLDAAEEALQTVQDEYSAQEATRDALEALDSERRHNAELDAALGRLRAELNARVRPELSDLASAFLADITGGRYTALEIDENYNVLVLDEGEEKPVISGGEEDVANLVLRLAISQMIAERAGHPLSVLILDEVFASLDADRRDNVVQLLYGLTTRFEQVILISHIEAIRDGLDHVVDCAFDERTGSSRVTDGAGPTPGPGEGPGISSFIVTIDEAEVAAGPDR